MIGNALRLLMRQPRPIAPSGVLLILVIMSLMLVADGLRGPLGAWPVGLVLTA